MSKSIERVIIERAMALIKRRQAHGCEAMDRGGHDVHWRSDKAVAFCAVGAIKRASYDVLGKGKWVKVANRIERECDRIADDLYGLKVLPGKIEVFFVNDRQSKKDVLAVFEQRLSEL